MPRRYQHISNYENEILEMRKKGVTTREIADRFGLSREQIKGFIKRRNRKIRMIEAGQVIHKKGRPSKSDNGIPPSMSRRGNPYDNALAENFFSILKTDVSTELNFPDMTRLASSYPNTSASTTTTVFKLKQN